MVSARRVAAQRRGRVVASLARGRERRAKSLTVKLIMATTWLNEVRWTDEGLVPVIVQEIGSDRVLMFAWMNREALKRTAETGEAYYWSRSRRRLWHKGEESGHIQRVREIRIDCDEDVLLLSVEQEGGLACHTGRASCFFQRLENGRWVTVEPVVKPPEVIYGKKS